MPMFHQGICIRWHLPIKRTMIFLWQPNTDEIVFSPASIDSKKKKHPHKQTANPSSSNSFFFSSFLLRYLPMSFISEHFPSVNIALFHSCVRVAFILSFSIWWRYLFHRCATSYEFSFISALYSSMISSCSSLFFWSSSLRHLFDIKSLRTGGFFSGQIHEHEAMISLLFFLFLFFFFLFFFSSLQ